MKYYVIWSNLYNESDVQSFDSKYDLEKCLTEILAEEGRIHFVIEGHEVLYEVVEVATKVKVK